MKKEYQNWIDNYNLQHKVVAGFCFSASSLMLKEFPELELKRGYVTDIYYNKRSHWWLQDSFGEIIDPTVKQFYKNGIEYDLKYEEYSEEIHGELPTGKCYNCGNNLFNNKQFCNDICEKETFDSLNKVNFNV